MFSIIRKLGVLQQSAKTGSLYEALSGAKFIATSDLVQNTDSLIKRDNKVSLVSIEKQKFKKTVRILKTLNHSIPLADRATVSKEESREFMAVFPDLVSDLTERASKYDSKHTTKWIAKALQYNVPCGKKNRGLITVLTFKQLVDKTQLTPENIRLAQYLGWCVEMMHGAFLISDDIMDGGITRRGQPCWHTLEDVGLNAINDSSMIESGIFYILKKYFSHTDLYVKLLDLFHEIFFITTLGQSLDLQITKKNVTKFTMEKYKNISYNKTSYYTLFLPVALGMYMAGVTDQEVFRQARRILLEMGLFMQVENDFLDVFGDPAITGQIGTDIQDNKCSWLAVVCMQRASDEQKEIMRECYGQNDPSKVDRVKHLYNELGLQNTYAIYEEESYNSIRTHIQQTSRDVQPEIFFKILDKIYKRDY